MEKRVVIYATVVLLTGFVDCGLWTRTMAAEECGSDKGDVSARSGRQFTNRDERPWMKSKQTTASPRDD